MDVAHLPAYRAAGLEVTGLYDLDPARAAEVAARHGVPRTYGSPAELPADDRVAAVDTAVWPRAQPDIARQALDGTHENRSGDQEAAVAEGGEPETSGRDDLGTLRLLEALYASMDSGESRRLGPA